VKVVAWVAYATLLVVGFIAWIYALVRWLA
jgi:hypothetical protein